MSARTSATRIGTVAVFAGLLACALLPSPAHATPDIMRMGLPNGAAVLALTSAKCTFCHTMASPGMCPDKPCLTAEFGVPFQTTGWTTALAMMDLDADGFTNGQELQDFAGTWMSGMPHPGIAAHVTGPYSNLEHPGLHDADMDHVCWVGRDTNNDGVCTATGERSSNDRDCDDTNDLRYSGAPELCDGADQDCDGKIDEGLVDCDPGAGDCPAGQGQNKPGECHPRERIDGDQDGICITGTDLSDPPDWDCMDEGEQTALADCNDRSVTIRPGAPELCLDGDDNDCDARIDAADSSCTDYLDRDGDGFCPGGEDLDADHECDTADEAESEARDCDDDDVAVRPGAAELCTNDVDDDCDALLDGRDESCTDYRDADGDGFCVAGPDRNADGLCDGRNEQSSTGDCDEEAANVYPGAPENCIDGRDNDCDGENDESASCVTDRDEDDDGYCPLGRDLNGDGDCDDSDEDEAVSDCDDASEEVNPDQVEACTGLVDDDCDGRVDLADDDCARLLDADEDAYCPGGHDINGDHDCLDADEENAFHDCDDDDDAVRPRAGEVCDDGIDNDCNGARDGFDPACMCSSDEMCPVSQACQIGACLVGVGCLIVNDPACVMDAGTDAGDGSVAMGQPDAGGTGIDAGTDAGDVEEPPAMLEDVGLGCGITHARGRSDAAPCALGLLLALGFLVRCRRRARRPPFIPDRS